MEYTQLAMVALKTHFDGQQIITPPELQGSAPREVVVVIEDETPAQPVHSIWDVLGKASVLRTTEEINRQVREERASWDEK